VDIQIVQMIGDDEECVPITSHSFTWLSSWYIWTIFGLLG
jgi:hypothetical protein